MAFRKFIIRKQKEKRKEKGMAKEWNSDRVSISTMGA
jgi:hypothetical protein